MPAAILWLHSAGPLWCTEVPSASTATVTGMSFHPGQSRLWAGGDDGDDGVDDGDGEASSRAGGEGGQDGTDR